MMPARISQALILSTQPCLEGTCWAGTSNSNLYLFLSPDLPHKTKRMRRLCRAGTTHPAEAGGGAGYLRNIITLARAAVPSAVLAGCKDSLHGGNGL